MRNLANCRTSAIYARHIPSRARKTQENVQFWRDLLEITTELRELEERYEMENKIAGIFNSIKS